MTETDEGLCAGCLAEGRRVLRRDHPDPPPARSAYGEAITSEPRRFE